MGQQQDGRRVKACLACLHKAASPCRRCARTLRGQRLSARSGQGGRVWDAWATSQQRMEHLSCCSTSSYSAKWTVPPAPPTTASCARSPAAASAQGRGAQTPRAPPHQRAWASQAGQTPPARRARAIEEDACGCLQCWLAECSSAGKANPPPTAAVLGSRRHSYLDLCAHDGRLPRVVNARPAARGQGDVRRGLGLRGWAQWVGG